MKKYEQVLLVAAKMIMANVSISKKELKEMAKEGGMELISDEELKKLAEMVLLLHKKIKAEKHTVILKKTESPDKVAEALDSFRKRGPTLLNAPSILKEVIDDFALSEVEQNKLKKIVKGENLKARSLLDGNIERAYSRLKDLFIKNPSSVSVSVIDKIADEEGVRKEVLKKKYKEELPALIEYRKVTPIID